MTFLHQRKTFQFFSQIYSNLVMLPGPGEAKLCNGGAGNSSTPCDSNNQLVWILRVQLAEALNLQDRNLVAKLYETLRCLSLFDSDGCRRLVRSLKEDYKNRSPYLSYLIRCRQGLLAALAHQERLLSRLRVERDVCSSYMISVVVRMFLEKKDADLAKFRRQFKETQAADEKTALMEVSFDYLSF